MKLASRGFRLLYNTSQGTVTREFEQARVLIGRSHVCDVVLDSEDVSRAHAVVLREGDNWVIQDVDSRGGTTVNGERVGRLALHDRDRILLAPASQHPVELTFRLGQAATGQPSCLVEDSGERTIVRQRIDLQDFDRTLFQAAGWGKPPAANPVSAPLAPETNSTAGLPAVGPQAGLPFLGLVKQVSEILLTSEGLEEILENVLRLTLEGLPGQRGMVCLYDEKTNVIEPKRFRTRTRGASEPFRVSRSILQEAIQARQATLVTNAAVDPRFHAAKSVQEIGIQVAMCVPLYHANQIKGLIYLDSQENAATFQPRHLETLTVLGLLVAVGIAQSDLRRDVARERAIRDRLSRYSSPRVVEQIIRRGTSVEGEMHAEEREVSVLFADLGGFTQLAESLPSTAVIQLLNSVFGGLASAVFQFDGTLDKYIGDAVMAVFGAPMPQEDHACRAVRTALRMRQLVEEGNRARPAEQSLRLRIGINSGKVIAGDIGSPLRKEYTVIGDAVNTASRLESSVAQPGDIVIGPETYAQVREMFECEALPEIQLRGKQHRVLPYRVLGPRADKP